MRSEREFSTDGTKYNSTVFDEYDSLVYDVKYSKSGRPKALIPKTSGSDAHRSRHMVSVIDEGIYKRGVFKKLGFTKKLKAALYLGLSQARLRKLFIDFINDAGLPLLNELILDYGGPSIKAVLDVVRRIGVRARFLLVCACMIAVYRFTESAPQRVCLTCGPSTVCACGCGSA